MIKLAIPNQDGTKKTYVAGPITMGLQKALARYGRDSVEAARVAQQMQSAEVNLESEEGIELFNTVMTAAEHLTETQNEIILRAFGGQFGPDDLDNVGVDEIARVIQELQGFAYGVVRKNV